MVSDFGTERIPANETAIAAEVLKSGRVFCDRHHFNSGEIRATTFEIRLQQPDIDTVTICQTIELDRTVCGIPLQNPVSGLQAGCGKQALWCFDSDFGVRSWWCREAKL